MECLGIKSFQQDVVRHNEMLARYVCQSWKQENSGMVDVQMIHQIIQNGALDSTSLHYKDTVGFIEAYHHLHQLSKDRDGGLLENNLICEAHKILMNHRKHMCTIGEYSSRDRLVEFEGNIHYYTSTVGKEIQRLIDEYNKRWFTINCQRVNDGVQALKDLIHLLAWLVYTFLEIHPFGDGNGRIIRLLFTYIMEAYGFPFPVPIVWYSQEEFSLKDSEEEYRTWCKILRRARLTDDFTDLENMFAHSLKKCSETSSTFITIESRD
ncbi:MAG: hypothetical protein DSY43_06780 [Gammaproteobacteria bacterium]|nr:MAG: hypothetical protein DSY43_06780 [Gammaproteobacteria bacterium]